MAAKASSPIALPKVRLSNASQRRTSESEPREVAMVFSATGNRLSRRTLLLGAAICLPFFTTPGMAQEKLRVAKSVTSSFFFSLLELGQEQGHYKAQGLNIEISAFSGDARMQQAFTAGAIDIGLGSGPGMGFAAKGVPAIAVAAIANQPLNMAMVVDPKYKSVDDLKGKRVAVTTAGSLTDWLARRLSLAKGWGATGYEVLPMGETRTRLAAMKRGDIAGLVTATEVAINLEQEGVGKIVSTFGEAVEDFHTHVVIAHRDLIKNRPETVRKFLRAWFTTAKFVKENKDATVASVARTMKLPPNVIAIAYDKELSMTNYDGAFNPKALEVIRQSLKELEILDRIPEVKELFMPGFVPVKID
jgi:NitT/TauT family transport system substrate-binding protein